jgi:hypothetical protein
VPVERGIQSEGRYFGLRFSKRCDAAEAAVSGFGSFACRGFCADTATRWQSRSASSSLTTGLAGGGASAICAAVLSIGVQKGPPIGVRPCGWTL